MKSFLIISIFLLSLSSYGDSKQDIQRICTTYAKKDLKNKDAVCECVGKNLVATGFYSAVVIKLYEDWMAGKIDEAKANNNPNFLYLSMASETEYHCDKDPNYQMDRNHH